MKSSHSNINNELTWDSSILELSPKNRPSQSVTKLYEANFKQLKDLLWILPLRVQPNPILTNFSSINEGQLFLGRGTVVSLKLAPAFGRRGKSGTQLFNAQVVIKDILSDQYLNLKFFNAYPGIKNQIEQGANISFLGLIQEYKGIFQIINPKINPKEIKEKGGMLVEYPTVAGVAGNYIKGIINKIPIKLWSESLAKKNYVDSQKIKLEEAFSYLHGKNKTDNLNLYKERVIYEEFFNNQLKLLARKLKNKGLKAPVLKVPPNFLSRTKRLFSYKLTPDQENVIEVILKDFTSGNPMMRMIQGDVGCGKTSVAIAITDLITKLGGQVALMSPTEALALQHADTFRKIFKGNIKIVLLLGSKTSKEKKEIYSQLQSGAIDLIIGTHSLFQNSVIFKNLQLAIIDEQHKFGVEQRLKLIKKGRSVHSLIMTATPIPRTLQLSQYGDLDISTIRTMPKGRKTIQTRIINPASYQKYLTFISTRLSLGEQIYIVVPAIEESEALDIKNINSIYSKYSKYFPEYSTDTLHGQLKAEEKKSIMDRFSKGQINLLISTSIIEVGINILNASTMCIYNPERFGLSSLHQLRGRVGRGDRSGFCFLINTDQISLEAEARLKVIEKTNDGFEIAEADLKNRGQGDIFGKNQSGHTSSYKIANIVNDLAIFERVAQDIEKMKDKNTEEINNILLELISDSHISTTI